MARKRRRIWPLVLYVAGTTLLIALLLLYIFRSVSSVLSGT